MFFSYSPSAQPSPLVDQDDEAMEVDPGTRSRSASPDAADETNGRDDEEESDDDGVDRELPEEALRATNQQDFARVSPACFFPGRAEWTCSKVFVKMCMCWSM